MKRTSQKVDRLFSISIVSTLVLAIACFTPILSGLFYVAQLRWVMKYVDAVLFPTLGLSIVIMIASYLNWRDAGGSDRI